MSTTSGSTVDQVASIINKYIQESSREDEVSAELWLLGGKIHLARVVFQRL